MGSYDFVSADELGKNDWPFFWPLVLEFGSQLDLSWARFDPLAKRRSGKPGCALCNHAAVALPGQMHTTRLVHGPQLHVSSSAD